MSAAGIMGIAARGGVAAVAGSFLALLLGSGASWASGCTDPGTGPALTLTYYGAAVGNYCAAHQWLDGASCTEPGAGPTLTAVDGGSASTGVESGSTYEFEAFYEVWASGGPAFSAAGAVTDFTCDGGSACASGDGINLTYPDIGSLSSDGTGGSTNVWIAASDDGGTTWAVQGEYAAPCGTGTCTDGNVDPTASGYFSYTDDATMESAFDVFDSARYAGGVVSGDTYKVESAYEVTDNDGDDAWSASGAVATYTCAAGCVTGDLVVVESDSTAYSADVPAGGGCNVWAAASSDGGSTYYVENLQTCGADSYPSMDPTNEGNGELSSTWSAWDLADNNATTAQDGYCSSNVWPTDGGGGGADPVDAGFSTVEGELSGYLLGAIALVLATAVLGIGISMLRRWMKRAGSV